MKRTIAVFQNMIGHAPEVEMWDDKQCRTALNELPMKEAHDLADDFDKEEVGFVKSDLCRLVMLYSTGGYYFDTDIAPLAALQKALDPRATFVTIRACAASLGGGGFFQAFMATAPRHPVIKIAMMNLVLISLPLEPFAITVLVFLVKFLPYYSKLSLSKLSRQETPSSVGGQKETRRMVVMMITMTHR